MSNLPHEVIIEILSWVPVKSLLRFKCVCKCWRTLFTNPYFIKLHLNRSIELDRFSLFFKSGPDLFDLHFPIDFESSNQAKKLDFAFDNELLLSRARTITSCNGLLCFYSYPNNVYLLNLSTKELKKLPENTTPHFPTGYRLSRFPIFGFGYSVITEEYKVLRIAYYLTADSTTFKSEVKVYTLGTKSWRKIDDISGAIRDRSGILVNGALHWIATRGNGSTSVVILSFDIGIEKFRDVPQPYFEEGNKKMTSLGVLRGCLCMFDTCYNNHVEIWVMNEYGVKESWTHKFTIRIPLTRLGWIEYFKALSFLQDGQVLLETSGGQLVMYNPKSERLRDLTIGGIPERFDTVAYVESLVSVKEENECV